MSQIGLKWLAIVVLSYLAWIIIAQGVANQYANTNSTNDAVDAIQWDENHAKALFNVGKSQTNNNVSLLKQSLRQNPADSRVVLALAGRLANAGFDSNSIDQLVKLATELRPSDGDVQIQVASYFAEKGDIQQALRHWDQALSLTKDYDDKLFPVLLSLLKQYQISSDMETFVKTAKDWWIRFYYYLARQPNTLPLLEATFNLRKAQQTDKREQQVLINMLQVAGQWDKSYLYWLNGLDQQERKRIGLLFDGGFEQEINNYGFGWHAVGDTASMRTEYGIGVSGKKAMHLIFKGSEKPFYHLYQLTKLLPGKYVLKGRSRSVSLRSLKGLRWRSSCVSPDKKTLAHSVAFSNGNTPWEGFKMEFEVPLDCTVQEIRLIVEGRNGIERRVRGELWLDSLEIKHI